MWDGKPAEARRNICFICCRRTTAATHCVQPLHQHLSRGEVRLSDQLSSLGALE